MLAIARGESMSDVTYKAKHKRYQEMRTVKTILDKGLESEPIAESPQTLTDTYVNGGRFGRNLQSLLIH
jgi:hypothetical protein